MTAVLRPFLPLCGAWLLLGCQPAERETPSTPIPPWQTVTSRSGALQLSLWPEPSPPPRGTFDAALEITEDGNPVDGLRIDVTPWMAAMQHGSNITPTVLPQGEGLYRVTGISTFMSGEWTLQLSLTGARSDAAAFVLDIR